MKTLLSSEIKMTVANSLSMALEKAARTGNSRDTIRLAKFLLRLSDKFDDFYVEEVRKMKPLLDESVTKITVLNLETGEEIAVITNSLITTAKDCIVVKVTPEYESARSGKE